MSLVDGNCSDGRMSACRFGLTTDDGRRLLDQLIVLQRRDHEESEVDATRSIAREHRIADVRTPHGQSLTLALPSSPDAPMMQTRRMFALDCSSTTRLLRCVKPSKA